MFTLNLFGKDFMRSDTWIYDTCVLDHGEGVCADPRRGDAILGVGAPGPPKGTVSISWVRTGEERICDKMTKDDENGSLAASRSGYAQSECHHALYSNSVTYPLWELCLIVLLYQENKSFGASCHLHSSSDVRGAVSGTTWPTHTGQKDHQNLLRP